MIALLNWFDWLYGIRHVSGVHIQSIPQNSAKSTLDNNYFLVYTYFHKDNNSIWGSMERLPIGIKGDNH